MTPLGTITKDPDAKLRYEIDWTVWLEDDLIRTSEWVVPAGIVGYDDAIDSEQKRAFIWLRGGKVGTIYTITNRIKTVYGEAHDETDERSILVKVENR